MAIELYAPRLPAHRNTDGSSLAWGLTGLLDSCRTGAGGGHTVGSSTDSSMSQLLSDSTLDSSRVFVTS